MKRILPHPWLTLALTLTWLVLNATLHPAHWALGILIALALPHLLPLPASRALRRPDLALRLLAHFLVDLLRANWAVARVVLSVGRQPPSAFVWVPLELRDPTALTILASLITLTPGTLACELDPIGSRLRVHALDASDPAALIADIQTRYANPLKAIFEVAG